MTGACFALTYFKFCEAFVINFITKFSSSRNKGLYRLYWLLGPEKRGTIDMANFESKE